MSKKYIDVHTHYAFKDYEDLKKIYETENIVGLCSSTDLHSYKDLEKLKEKNINNLFFSYGLYPDVLNNKTLEECYKELDQIDFSKGIAIGEIGLDNKITKDKQKREEQKKLFEKQLEIAESKKLPVVVHSRYASKHVLETLTNFKIPTILHWFSGTDKEIDEAFSRGYFLSLNYDRTKVNITEENINQIFIETDYPIPYNNKTNILNIKEAYKIVAYKNSLNINYLQEKIQENFYRLFKIKI